MAWLIENMDMTHNSQKACRLIKKLSNGPTEIKSHADVTPNQTASQLFLKEWSPRG